MATVTIEPVAWRYRQYETYDWDTSYDPAEMKPFIAEFPSWQAGPLFTSEALAQARAEGKAEGMRDARKSVNAVWAKYQEEQGWDVATKGRIATDDMANLILDAFDTLPAPPADGETRPQPMNSEALFDWLQEHHKSVGVTPALREMYRRYRQAKADGETKL